VLYSTLRLCYNASMQQKIIKYDIPAGKYVWDNDFPFSLVDVHSEHDFPMHTHAFTELVIVFEGHAVHTTSYGDYPIRAGDVFVITGNEAHGYRDTHQLQLVNVKFDAERFLPTTPDVRELPGFHALFTLEPRYRRRRDFNARLRLTTADLIRVKAVTDAILREELERPPGFRSMIRAHFTALVVLLARLYADYRNASVRPLMRIGAALSYMETHFADDISIAELARVAQLSPRQFTRGFTHATGQTPMQYLISLRIFKACELLRTTSRSITDVAFGTGFNDSCYFSTQFKRVVGVSPRVYRQRSAR